MNAPSYITSSNGTTIGRTGSDHGPSGVGEKGPGLLVDDRRYLIDRRLSKVWRLLARVREQGDDGEVSARVIHKLRVATRRAGTSIRSVPGAGEQDAGQRLLRRLKKIRRAAAGARDADVQGELLGTLFEDDSGDAGAALKVVRKHLRRQRERSITKLLKHASKRTSLLRAHATLVENLPDALRPGSDVQASQEPVDRVWDEVREAGRSDLRDLSNMHRLRIAIKHARYALETLEQARAQVDRLVRLQDELGHLNDLRIARELLLAVRERARDGQELRKKARRGFEHLLSRVDSELSSAHSELLNVVGDGVIDDIGDRLGLDRQGQSAPERSEPTRAPAIDAGGGQGDRAGDGHERIAAIDVGTNSVRLIVAAVESDGSLRVLDDEKVLSRLGRGLDATGGLSERAMRETAMAVSRMRSIALGYGAGTLRVIGTAAVREADNGDVFLRMLREVAGVELEVVSSEKEALLSYSSVAAAFDLRSARAGVVDIGGGSTEIVLSAPRERGSVPLGVWGGVIDRVLKIPIGAVKLTERFGGARACAGERFAEMKREARRLVEHEVGSAALRPDMLVGVGGTLSTLGSMSAHKEYGPAAGGLFESEIQGRLIRRAEVKQFIGRLRDLGVEQRSRIPGLASDRVDIILAGLVIVDAVMRGLRIDELRVHLGGVRDGVLAEMVSERFRGPGARDAERDPLVSVRRFARGCGYESGHSEHVAGLALSIFDQLSAQGVRGVGGVGRLGSRERVLLESAAVLHDVGYLINYAGHHKHSYHLILHAELPGLTKAEQRVVACVARYHRRSGPKKSHGGYAGLSGPDRERVRKLAAILRVADGLDRTHSRVVRGVRVFVEGGSCVLRVSADEEPSVDMWGAHRKGGLFERVFGVSLSLEWDGAEPVPSALG